ncbi:MAG: hypothetical protein ABR529_01000 [Actinomycetota bacterium]
MKPRRALAVSFVAAVVLAPPLLASAHPVSVRDGNDAKGRFDIRRVKKFGTDKPGWRVIVRQRWRAREVVDHGYLLTYLDTFGTSRYDYYALIRSDGRRMKGALLRDRARKNDYRVSSLKVWRRDRRSVSMRIPLRRVKTTNKRDHYNWAVQSVYTSPRCKRVCFDRAPNDGGVEEPLGQPAPTPAPTG